MNNTFRFNLYIIPLILFPALFIASCDNSTFQKGKENQENIHLKHEWLNQVKDVWSINVSNEKSQYDFGLGTIRFVLKQDTLKYFVFNYYDKNDSAKLSNIRSKEIDFNSNPPLFYDKYTEKYCILLAAGRNTCDICVNNNHKNICSHLNTIFDTIIFENESLDINEIINRISESKWEWEHKGNCSNRTF